jgi:CheY-like chemotaxis protein
VSTSDEDPFVLAAGDMPLFADAPAPEGDTPPEAELGTSWKVLVVDDDAAVHEVTTLALRRFEVDGHPVRLLRAHSGADAAQVLRDHPDCALALLDVVMETEEAGLHLVQRIRRELGADLVRLVLRTGQPGRAPEQSVMAEFDVHDYLEKTAVSAQRLRTTVTGAIRAYRDLRTIAMQRQGLERVLRATGGLFEPQNVATLLSGILDQVAALCVPNEHAIFFLARAPIFQPSTPEPFVLAATGRFATRVGDRVQAALDDLGADAEASVEPGCWSFLGEHGVFGFEVEGLGRPAIFVEGARSMDDARLSMIASFCASAGTALNSQQRWLEHRARLSRAARWVPFGLVEEPAVVDDVGAPTLDPALPEPIEMAGAGVLVFEWTWPLDSTGVGPRRALQVTVEVLEAAGGRLDRSAGPRGTAVFPGGRVSAWRAARALFARASAEGLLGATGALECVVDGGPVRIEVVEAGRSACGALLGEPVWRASGLLSSARGLGTRLVIVGPLPEASAVLRRLPDARWDRASGRVVETDERAVGVVDTLALYEDAGALTEAT